MSFAEKEKIKAFDLIADRFFKRNFGTMSKTDFETLLFHIYLEQHLDNNLPFDDYVLSKELGISQAKIRNLKLKKELQYPREGFKWTEAFASYLKNAHYDKDAKLIRVVIPDINVLTELRSFVETNGWYDEYHLNPKLFQCNLDFFIKLCEKLNQEPLALGDEAEEKLKQIREIVPNDKERNAINKILSGAAEEGVRTLIMSASKEIVLSVLNVLPFGGVAASIIQALITVIERT